MKKRLLWILLTTCMVFAICGCKKDTEKDESVTEETISTEEKEIPVVDKTVEKEGIDAFVKVGEYKGLQLEKVVHTVTEEDIDNQIQAELATLPVYDNDPERVVEVGDVVNLDYSGSVDGVVFDGGTAYGYDLEIGSGSFIEGFEEQLVGMHVGESRDITVTFPENYQAAELAGAEAVFACTINAIAEYVTEPTEEWLQMHTVSGSLEEYREEIKNNLEIDNSNASENELHQSAWAELAKTAEYIQYPKDMLDQCFEEQKLSYESYAMMYGMDYDSFLESMNVTEDDLYEDAKNDLQSALLAMYVIDKEGIETDNEDYQALEETILISNGFATKEDAIAAGISEWNITYVINYNFVMDFLVKNAVITEVEAE